MKVVDVSEGVMSYIVRLGRDIEERLKQCQKKVWNVEMKKID